MSNEEKRIVEINGVKLEIDLRTAKRVDSFKVGDPLRVLIKQYGDSYVNKPGIIIGFDEFKERPSIRIMYFDEAYSSDTPIKFASLNCDSKDIEIAAADLNELRLCRDGVVECLDRKIEKAQMALSDAHYAKNLFLKQFNRVVEDVE